MQPKIYKPHAIFILLLFCIDLTLGYGISYFAKKQKHDNRVELILNNQIKADIIILGSSRALNNYNPQIISAITGKTCYNLGVSGSTVLFHETILDLLLSQQTKPKYIIYNIDDYGLLYEVDGIAYRTDILMPYVDNDIINKQVCKQLNKPLWATNICQTYKHNINFINALRFLIYGKEDADYKTTNIDSLGANIIVQREIDTVPNFLQKRKLPIKPQNTAFINSYISIQQKCSANGIKLILCYPPLFAKSMKGFKQSIEKVTTAELLVLDYSELFNDATFFFNPDHLNQTGANKFSNKLADKIKQHIQ